MTISRSFYLLLGLFSFYGTLSYAQGPHNTSSYTKASIDKELDKLKRKILLDPKDESLLLRLKTESEELAYEEGILSSGDKLMIIYMGQSRNKETIELADQLKKIALNKKDPKGIISNIFRKSGLALGYLGLEDASLKDFKTAIKYAETIDDVDRKLYLLSLCYQNLNVSYTVKQLDDEKYGDSSLYILNKSLDFAYRIKDNNKSVTNDQKYSQIAFNNMRLGMLYLRGEDTDSNLSKAEKYLLESQKIYENKDYKISLDEKTILLNQLSWLYLEKKDYKTSIDYANRAMQLEKQHPNPYNRVESFEFLSSCYLETGEKEQSKFYMDKYTLLKDSLNLADKKTANVLMKEMVSEVKDDHKEELSKLWIWASIIFFAGTILTWVLWRKRNKIIHEKYEQIIDRLKNNTTGNPGKTPSQTKNVISNDTGNDLMIKLEMFENSERFLKPDITIGFLSGQFNTNPKYLSEIIKKNRSQNFSSYINNLRIDHIVSKLYNEPKYREYKISYLAEQCGFASPQVFIIAFRKVNGVTPFYFIQQLKNSDTNLK